MKASKRYPLLAPIVIAFVYIMVSITSSGDKLSKYETLDVVQRDLDSLINIYAASTKDETTFKFSCKIDEDLTDNTFGYTISKGGKVCFIGGDEMALSHSAYTFLEELGFIFDITGVSTPAKFNLASEICSDTLITPRVRWRGIRQHVNFPMDISSYAIEDAKKYIDDLVRLRFNKLTIHSYPGQWYESQVADTTMYAGHFFYGNKHFQYDNELLKRMIPENDSLFCIPQSEKLHRNPAELSKFAMGWMSELIEYAKSRGFYIQFSFESRADNPNLAVATAQNIYNTYPSIDALEFITEETGGWGKGCTREEVTNTLNTLFSAEIANNKSVTMPIKEKQSDLNYLYSQIGINAKAINQLKEQNLLSDIELKLGIYCSITNYSKGAYRLARLALPDTKIALLSSHGSEGVAKAIPEILEDIEDLKHTEIYSWIEFDGLMFLLQNSINGNYKLLEAINNLDSKEELECSILYNHWRTAENRTASRYVAESTIKPLDPDSFYDKYSETIDIKDKARYREALGIINEVDRYATSALGNIGFCWMGAWRTGGSFTYQNVDNIKKAKDMYLKAGNILSDLIKETPSSSNGHDYLAFLGNRTLCSILYLDAFLAASPIRDIKPDKNGNISKRDQAKAQELCNHALLIFDKYMETHAEMMPDRGCKGNLVSVWNAPIRGLKIYRSKLGGIPYDELPTSSTPVDAPPLPIFY